MSARQAVLILAGGPDPEHDVSLDSARGIERALRARGAFEPVVHPFETIDADALASLPGDVIWPALHGRFGEGGAMQRILESDGRPFVGSGSRAAEIAIDKAESKRAAHACARELGLDRVRTSETVAFDPSDGSAPMGFPFVVKPTHEGSTIGLHICRDEREWRRAHAGTARAGWEAMAEPFIEGRELTIGMVDAGAGLGCRPIIEITPAGGTYDYEAKYERDDTASADPGGDGARDARAVRGAHVAHRGARPVPGRFHHGRRGRIVVPRAEHDARVHAPLARADVVRGNGDRGLVRETGRVRIGARGQGDDGEERLSDGEVEEEKDEKR